MNDQGGSILKGIHVPCLTWFQNDATQDIDWKLQKEHIQFLVDSGVDGGKAKYINGRQ